jgi:hypothetical protein
MGERLIASYYIDGELAAEIDKNGVATPCPRSSAPDFDMSAYYEYFTEVEDGLWIAETMPMEEEGMEYLLQNVTVKTENGLLVSLSYDMTVAEAGVSMSVTLKLSLHGQVKVEADAQTLAILEAIEVLEELYWTEGALDNYTVVKTMTIGAATAVATYHFDGNVYELIGSIQQGDETVKFDPEIIGEYDAGTRFMEKSGGALFWALDAESLSYDAETGVYTLAGEHEGDASDVGADYAIIKNVTFTLKDGNIETYSYDADCYAYLTSDAEEATLIGSMSCVEVYSDWGVTVVKVDGMDQATHEDIIARLSYTGARTLDHSEEFYDDVCEMHIVYDGAGKCNVTQIWDGESTEHTGLDEDAELLQFVNDVLAFVKSCGQDGYIKSTENVYYFIGEYDEEEAPFWPQSVEISIDEAFISIRVDLGSADVHTLVLGIG